MTGSLRDILQVLMRREALPEDWLRGMLGRMMTPECPPEESAAFLVALRMKGETSAELAVAAEVLRAHMVRWDAGQGVVDTCGTGGDGTGTFNISTAAAIVLAGAGVPVVKHGNRSVSSTSGSADVLAALGVPLENGPEEARRSLDRAGLAFCFAPRFHPALKHVAPVRKALGIPTLFNCLGPLVNPAGATRQVLGVGRPELLDLMAGALAKLGTTRACLVCSDDGLDEVSLSAPTQVREVRGNVVTSHVWTPDDFGLPTGRLSDLKVGSAAESAERIRGLLQGEAGPALDIVLANAAVGLLVAERVEDLQSGVELARAAVMSGKAAEVLRRLAS